MPLIKFPEVMADPLASRAELCGVVRRSIIEGKLDSIDRRRSLAAERCSPTALSPG